jgi:CheY-like chemotaxis protein
MSIRTALSGQEALEAAPGFWPQLILCHMSLSDRNGLEVIRKL